MSGTNEHSEHSVNLADEDDLSDHVGSLETELDDNSTESSRQENSAAEENTQGKQVVVRPVVNAIRILKYLSQDGQPRRASQLAKDLNINSSTCFNILRTLVSEDALEFDPLSKAYKIGFGIIRIAERAMSEGERVSAIRPYLKEIAERFGVTVTLWRRIEGERIAQVAVEYCTRDTRIQVAPGRRGPMLMGATGRLLATRVGLSKAEVEARFASIRWARPLSFEEYWREVEIAETRGWAIDDGYFYGGTTNVAAPILGPNNEFMFAIVALMFRGQYDAERITQLGEALKALGQRLG